MFVGSLLRLLGDVVVVGDAHVHGEPAPPSCAMANLSGWRVLADGADDAKTPIGPGASCVPISLPLRGQQWPKVYLRSRHRL